MPEYQDTPQKFLTPDKGGAIGGGNKPHASIREQRHPLYLEALKQSNGESKAIHQKYTKLKIAVLSQEDIPHLLEQSPIGNPAFHQQLVSEPGRLPNQFTMRKALITETQGQTNLRRR